MDFSILYILNKGNIGIFDSGYGGLTVLKNIIDLLPEYNYIYLGDNARAPYGAKSFDLVNEYTQQSVQWLFEQGADLVILACNTASAKALRYLQQNWLPLHYPKKRILGVIRPTAEYFGALNKEFHLGILGTIGTISSNTYLEELNQWAPKVKVAQHACPLWVPFIEEGLIHMDSFHKVIQKDIATLLKDSDSLKTILLACTHYPLILKDLKHLYPTLKFISQGPIVAESLKRYLHKHADWSAHLSKNQIRKFYTTDDAQEFSQQGSRFFERHIRAEKINLINHYI